MTRPSLAKRYRDGEYEEVWFELGWPHDGPDSKPSQAEIEDIAQETFSRVRRNLEILIDRLRTVGYVFESEDVGTPDRIAAAHTRHAEMVEQMTKFVDRGLVSESSLESIQSNRLEDEVSQPPLRPTPENALNALEVYADQTGPVPVAFSAFAKIVGEVDFRQTHREPKSPCIQNDAVLSCLGDWDPFVFWIAPYELTANGIARQPELQDDGGLANITRFAPDNFHKANVSGIDGYRLRLPNDTPDPVIETVFMPNGNFLRTTFLTYLRAVIGRGGFFGSPEAMRFESWDVPLKQVEPNIFLPDHPVFATLAEDLLAF